MNTGKEYWQNIMEFWEKNVLPSFIAQTEYQKNGELWQNTQSSFKITIKNTPFLTSSRIYSTLRATTLFHVPVFLYWCVQPLSMHLLLFYVNDSPHALLMIINPWNFPLAKYERYVLRICYSHLLTMESQTLLVYCLQSWVYCKNETHLLNFYKSTILELYSYTTSCLSSMTSLWKKNNFKLRAPVC